MRSPSAWSACRPPQVPTRRRRLTPSWISSSKTIVAPRAAHARSLHGDALALPRPGVAEQAALPVDLRRLVEERLRDVLRPERVAGQETGVRVVAGLGAEVDRHARNPTDSTSEHAANPLRTAPRVFRPCPKSSSSRSGIRFSASARRTRSSACSSRTSPGAGSAGSSARAERGRARRALPRRRQRRSVGQGLRRVRSRRRARGAADAHRRAGRGRRALGGRRDAASEAARGSPGPAGVRDSRCRPRRATQGCVPPTLDDLELLMPACAAAHEQELGVDPMRRDAGGLSLAHARQIEDGRSWLWVEDGTILFKAEASAWTPRRGAAPAGLGRPGRPPARATARAGCATSAGSCSSASRRSASSFAPRTSRRSGCTRRSGWSTSRLPLLLF